MIPDARDRCRGLLVGIAVGDAIGLPVEGISRTRAARMFNGPWRHRFLFGHGMISDDTEHSLFVVQSLLAHPKASDAFGRRLSWCLRWWFTSLPAGVGLATARACIKLWLGCGHRKSGVRSAGNGAAMRSAPIGAFFCKSPDEVSAFTEVCTAITHSDPRALTGAKAVAVTAAWILRDDLRDRPPSENFSAILSDVAPEDAEWTGIVARMGEGLRRNASVDEFASAMGLEKGVTGYVYHTVPIALYAWHRHFGNYRATLGAVLDCGGDADTTGGIVGGLAGLTVGENGIPKDWVEGIADWPRTTTVLRSVADRLSITVAGGKSPGPVKYFWPGVVPRNAVFLFVVLMHGFRRLLPPY
jgi:ADP-ribosyl-[dinitrogen reductase] hydrolase